MSKRKVEQRFYSKNMHPTTKKRPPLLQNPQSMGVSFTITASKSSNEVPKYDTFVSDKGQKSCNVVPNWCSKEQEERETTSLILKSYDNQSFGNLSDCISTSKKQLICNKSSPVSTNVQSTASELSVTENSLSATRANSVIIGTQNEKDDVEHDFLPNNPQCNSKSRTSNTKDKTSGYKKSQNNPAKATGVEYVVLNPPSSKCRTKKRPHRDKRTNTRASFYTDDYNAGNISPVTLFENQTTFDAVSDSSLYQGPSTTQENDFRYLSSTGSYTGQQICSINPPIEQATHFVNPYRCLVTPQYPILNVSTDSTFYLRGNTSSISSLNSLQSTSSAICNESQFPDLSVNSWDTGRSTDTSGEKSAPIEKDQNKRVQKERPVKLKPHVNPQYLFNMIDNILDSQQIKSASNIVREIIRVLPLKRKASISWVDKETVLHAMDELTKHLENECKLQTRRSVLRYGFQAINPNFVPDATNTRCDIDDEEFSNKYKISQGFVKDSSRDSDSGSDTEQATRLADNKYYSCWISREYSKHICMQRLSVDTKGKDGRPTLFKGFKWGHPKLTADLETSFIVRPEHRVPFYQWLSKSIPSKPPKKSGGTKQGRADYVIMKVNLTKPKSDIKGLPKNLCECEFWEYNGKNRKCSVSYKYPRGMEKVIAFLAENHPLQPASFDKAKLQNIIFDCD
ncbi:hypothetical protein ACHWQZ_G016666 [Mnemiopsis leidyi]